MAQGEAMVARGNDPSTVFHNPAGIAHLEGTQIAIGSTPLTYPIEFTSRGTSLSGSSIGTVSLGSSGTVTDLDQEWFFPSHLYATHRLKDRVGVGLGLTTHFGLATEWPQDWEGRYISYLTDIKTAFLNPNIAIQIAPGVTVAAGIQYAYSTVELKKKVFLPSWGDADVDLGVADGDGWGYNLSTLIKVNQNNLLGINFRSPVQIHYGGQINYTLPSSPCPYGGAICTAVIAALSDTSATTDITMPALFSIGLANRSFDRLTLEFDLQWTGWSSMDQIVIQADNPNNPISIIDRRWNDVLALMVGGEYRLTPAFAVRAGYAYDPTPIPGETLDSILPDSDRHKVAMGLGFQRGKMTLDTAYMVVFFKDRNVNNQLSAPTPLDTTAVYNQVGTYKTIAHVGSISLSYRF